MPLALLVTLQSAVPAAPVPPKAAAGKSLVREADRLDFLARRCKVEPLSGMVSERREDLVAQMVAEGFDPAKVHVPPERWYPAAVGVASLAAIADHVAAHPNDVKQPGVLLRDLRAAHATLTAAAAAGVAFHFTRAEV